jgi:phosphate transport system substrate-binding protein
VPVPIPASPAPADPNAPPAPNAAAPAAPAGADPNASPAAPADPNAASPGAASPGAVPPETTAQAPAADAGASRGGIPLWLWALSLPLLGGLIWALLKGLGADDAEDGATGVTGAGPIGAGAVDAGAMGAGAVGAGAVGAGAVGAGALGAMLAGDQEGDNSRMILTARNAEEAYAYWEVPEAHKQQIRKEEGGQKLSVRLYDVTGLEFDRHPAHNIQEFDCEETDQDLHIPIPQPDRDYLVELGYVTYQGRWVKLAQSNPVHIAADGTATTTEAKTSTEPVPTLPMMPTPPNLDDSVRAGGVSLIDPPAGDSLNSNAFAAPTDFSRSDEETRIEETRGDAGFGTGAAVAGGMGLGAALGATGLNLNRDLDEGDTISGRAGLEASADQNAASSRSRVKRSQIVLVPRNSQEAYAYWDVLEHHKEIAKQHGGQNFILRICDVTGVDPEQQAPHSIQQFNCEETDRDRHVTVPDLGEYVAEIGYLAKNGRWLRIARSAPVHIPPVDVPVSDSLPFS